jgi:hypothetical protein
VGEVWEGRSETGRGEEDEMGRRRTRRRRRRRRTRTRRRRHAQAARVRESSQRGVARGSWRLVPGDSNAAAAAAAVTRSGEGE